MYIHINMKVAEVKYPIHHLIQTRRSPRAFAHTPIAADKLNSLFEAARWTASALNEQPWHYIYATKENPEAFARLLECLNPSNQVWAQHAPVLILSVVKTFFSRNGQLNTHAMYDVGAANTALALQATDLGLHVHQMGGFSTEKIRENFNLPSGYEPVTIMAVGYLGDPEQLPEQLKERELAPRQRHEITQFAFENGWEKAS